MRNDRKAQELLYKRFYRAAASLCMRYIHNPQDAMEVLNDGFLKVFRNIHSYDAGKSVLYTWIRKIMINTAINFLQQKQIVFAESVAGIEEEPTVENEILLKTDAEELLILIRQLPAATRVVFNLYTIEGFSHRDIAVMLEIGEGTSRWHLSEARKLIKQSLLAGKKST